MADVPKSHKFALVPKQLSSPFFNVTSEGCLDRAQKLGVECIYVGTQFPDVEGQAEIIRWLVDTGIDGIAVAVVDSTSDSTLDAIAYAAKMGVPLVTFDTDAASSERLTFIGTDNYSLGVHIGKINPTGGFYGIVSNKGSNGLAREAGVRSRLKGSKWVEIDSSPGDSRDSEVVSIGIMEGYMNATTQVPSAILSVGGWPTRNVTMWKDFANANPNVTTVVADTLPHQMDLLNNGYISGLVGQVPFQMGARAIDTLLECQQKHPVPVEILGTSLHEVVTVPLSFPELDVNKHQLGNLMFMGFTATFVLATLAIGCAIWTYLKRETRVVKASQPIFLTMIAGGVFIMSLSILPMTMDDGNFIALDSPSGKAACMSQIWLLSVGFTIVFAALFSKTWRINKIFNNPRPFSRMVVGTKDVLAPFGVLLTANIVVLLLFTILSPLEFVRLEHEGTDPWNRVISTYGICQSSTPAWPYIVALVVINTSALLFALVQAYLARSIESEFSESRHIAIVIASFVQMIAMALPVLLLVQAQPAVFYLVKAGIVFLLSVVVLVCIFFPKMCNTADFREESTQAGSCKSSQTHTLRQNPCVQQLPC